MNLPVAIAAASMAWKVLPESVTEKRDYSIDPAGMITLLMTVVSLIVGLQCILLFGTMKAFHYAGMMKLPPDSLADSIAQLLTMILTGIVGIALGLFVSAIVRTSEMATSVLRVTNAATSRTPGRGTCPYYLEKPPKR